MVVALVVGGGVGGWFLRGWISPKKAPVLALHAVVKRPVTPLTVTASGTMPSVIGLAQSEAQRALFDAGATASKIAVTSVPAAGDPGLVVTQQPAAGSDLRSGAAAVTLGVSVAAKVPNVIGQLSADARNTLAALGARVSVTQKYSPAATEGTVLSVSPKVGSTLPLTTSMVVASPASAVYLDALKTIESNCSDASSVTSNAVPYMHALRCQPGQDSPSTNSYVLNRKVAAFNATLGQDDTGQTGQTATVSILRDGKVVKSFTVPFGTQRKISVPLVGALRLSIVTSWAHPAQDAPGGPTVVLGNARMVGSPDAITALVAEAGR